MIALCKANFSLDLVASGRLLSLADYGSGTPKFRNRQQETARRKALWDLADLQSGNPRAIQILGALSEIYQAEMKLRGLDACSSQELMEVVRSRSHNGILLVGEDSIPDPGQQRFLAANVGSTRFGDRALSALPKVFVYDWSAEMSYLDAHPPLEITMMPLPSYCLTAVSCGHIRGLRYDSSSEKDADYEY